jgi:hypothetical protein
VSEELNRNNLSKTKHDYFGFYGTSPIDQLLSIPEQIPFDFMHLILQGHAKWLYNKLFFEKDCDLIKCSDFKEINLILKSTKIPHIINRKPSKIEECNRWKSSEIKLFLFYLSTPIFIGALSDWYFYRYVSYVIAVRMLYEPIENINCLKTVEDIFINYMKELNDIFSIEAYTYTIHAHLHLVEQVKQHGPLHSHSQFFF